MVMTLTAYDEALGYFDCDPRTPFLRRMLHGLKSVEDNSQSTGWTDGFRIGWNAEFLRDLDVELKLTFLAHEVLHVFFKHMYRRAGRDIKLWNIACDLAINQILVKAGFTPIPNWLYPGQGKYAHLPLDLSAEMYYEMLVNQQSQEQPQDQSQGDDQEDEGAPEPPQADEGDSPESDEEKGGDEQTPDDPNNQDSGTPESGGDQESDSGQEEAGGAPEDSEGESDQQASVPGAGSDFGEEMAGDLREPDVSPDEVADRQREIEANIVLSQADRIKRGSGLAAFGRVIGEAKKVRRSLESEIAEFVTAIPRGEEDWARPNRRFIGQGIYLPSETGEQLEPLAVAIDTSASIHDDLLTRFALHLNEIIALNPMSVIIIYCNNRVQRVERWEPGDPPIKFAAVGGGGTSHIPVFEVMRSIEDVSALICFTDLETVFPPVAPHYPVLWINFATNGAKAPFGRTIQLAECS